VCDVPAKRVAGGAPITPICAVLGQLVINCPCAQNGGSLRTGRGLPRSLSVIGMLARRVANIQLPLSARIERGAGLADGVDLITEGSGIEVL
jgi:hypothetical protein